jgi:serine protease Do
MNSENRGNPGPREVQDDASQVQLTESEPGSIGQAKHDSLMSGPTDGIGESKSISAEFVLAALSEPTQVAPLHRVVSVPEPEPISNSAESVTDQSVPFVPTAVDDEVSVPLAPMRDPTAGQLAYSTFLSLMVVLALLIAVRMIVPSLVESIRYSWYRGQLRAEYEMSGERLRSVSLDSLADVSQLVSQRVGPSVVHIRMRQTPEEQSRSKNGPLSRLQRPQQLLEGQGSGFVVDSDGYILTNDHVIDDLGDIEVTLSDGRRMEAYIVGSDPPTDLALIKVNAKGLMPVDWGDSEQVVVGSPVWAMGSPFGLQQTVTFGIISGKHRVDLRGTRYEDDGKTNSAYGDLMQSDVALNPGNSGGPLVNSSGEVVGVNAAILGETYRGISFSIPSKVARRVADQLVELGEVQRGWLGVMLVDLPDSQRFDDSGQVKPGVRVTGFHASGESPGKQAGMSLDDIIVSFDGKPVMSQTELRRMIAETDVGRVVSVEVLRDDERLLLEVTLGKREIR